MTYEEAKNKYSDEEEILRHLFEEADDSTYRRIIEVIINSRFLKRFLDKIYYFQPITKVESKEGCSKKIIIEEKYKKTIRKERLVALNKYDYVYDGVEQLHPQIFASPEYYLSGRPGSFGEIYVREGVAEALLEHISLLPAGYGIKIFDGYRTIECQKDIYDEVFKEKLTEELENYDNRNMSSKQVEEHVIKNIMPNYVSLPTTDPVATHNTGGAIDCRICDMNGVTLNYGCSYDEFSDVAKLNYFEEKLKEGYSLDDYQIEAMLNRRVTANIFRYPTKNETEEKNGAKKYNSFASFAGEEWHLDINNQWDTNIAVALYGSCEKDGIEPDPNYTILEYMEEREKIINK